MPAKCPAISRQFPNGATTTEYITHGPFEPGTVIDEVTIFGQDSSGLGSSTGMDIRVALFDRPPFASSTFDGGEFVFRRFKVDTPLSSIVLPLRCHERIGRSRRYVSVEITVSVVTGTYVAGANVSYRPPSKDTPIPGG